MWSSQDSELAVFEDTRGLFADRERGICLDESIT
jgi:hypothetical protein